jgi:hypothetical protein
MNNRSKEVNIDIEEIKLLISKKVEEHVAHLEKKFTENSSLLQLELQIKKYLNEHGKILLEKVIPIIYGKGYYGSSVKEKDEETGESIHYSCMLKKHTRALKTIFGDIKITRAYYQKDEDGSSIGLLDKRLDIHLHKVSPAVRYYSNLFGITTSYAEGKETFHKLLGISISSKEIDNFTQDKASVVASHFEKRVKQTFLDGNGKIEAASINASDDHSKIVYLETDGCHVPIRRRRGTRDWKECKTLLLFEVEKVEVEKNGKVQIQNRLINKKYFSCVEEIGYFKKQVKAELEHYCKQDEVKIVCVGDGAHWIWNMIGELIPRGKIEILDWYHVKEKITLLAVELYPKDKDETLKDDFVGEMKGFFYDNKFNEGIKLLEEKYVKTRSRKLQAKISQVMGYFKNNKERMNYQDYKKNGYCLGSGAIESANKYVIQRRMKIPGCSWTEEHADNVAQMRSEFINGNFDEWYGIEDNPMLCAT